MFNCLAGDSVFIRLEGSIFIRLEGSSFFIIGFDLGGDGASKVIANTEIVWANNKIETISLNIIKNQQN